MRIVVHGQEAFGKSVLEALLERGESTVGSIANFFLMPGAMSNVDIAG